MFDEIIIPPGVPLSRIAQSIEDFVDVNGLRVTQRAPVSTHPGALHWHIKRGKEQGTLEATLFNRERFVRLEIPKGRAGTWTSAALDGLGAALNDALTAPLPPNSGGF